jgi:hypothetical protein
MSEERKTNEEMSEEGKRNGERKSNAGRTTVGGMQAQEELERKTLRLLCSVLLKPVTRVELVGLLGADLFTEAVNRTVFEEIALIGPVSSARLREMLPARVTNRGFADFDLKEFLAPEMATEAEIEQLFESVLKMIEMRHGEADTAVEN